MEHQPLVPDDSVDVAILTRLTDLLDLIPKNIFLAPNGVIVESNVNMPRDERAQWRITIPPQYFIAVKRLKLPRQIMKDNSFTHEEKEQCVNDLQCLSASRAAERMRGIRKLSY